MNFFKNNKVSNVKNGKEHTINNEGLFKRMFKTRQSIANGLMHCFKTRHPINESTFQDIEDQLIMADFGALISLNIVKKLREASRKHQLTESYQLIDYLRTSMMNSLQCISKEKKSRVTADGRGPYVILMVGVNGAGKTTTLVKIAHFYRKKNKTVMMAACDTFRAAAIDQLQSWGKQLDIPVIAQAQGADAASVAFDAYNATRARGFDLLLIDTAGRLHTHSDLMEQLKKIKKVLSKSDNLIPHEILLTLDAGNGQNMHSQLENFLRVLELTGLCVTKLDGTAKGGALISIVKKHKIPVQYIGLGEKINDLRPFVATEFLDAVLPTVTRDFKER